METALSWPLEAQTSSTSVTSTLYQGGGWKWRILWRRCLLIAQGLNERLMVFSLISSFLWVLFTVPNWLSSKVIAVSECCSSHQGIADKTGWFTTSKASFLASTPPLSDFTWERVLVVEGTLLFKTLLQGWQGLSQTGRECYDYLARIFSQNRVLDLPPR